MTWKHVSTEIEYREPLGALRAGAIVRLSLLADFDPSEEEADYEVVLLVEVPGHNTQGAEWQEYAMERRQEKSRMSWSCQWKAPEWAGVCWYYFRIQGGGKQFFYGAAQDSHSGRGELAADAIPPCYQLTVYEKEFKTPEWFRNATMYQIFPDRYCRGRMENLRDGIQYHRKMHRKVYVHWDWEEIPYYQALQGETYYSPNDFFGGDLEGIRQSLGELEKMGITCIYLNPIVESESNHRYNTSDYKKVDPILGNIEDFERLCQEAEDFGIRIMLDGVYSHTGSDSIYFNKSRNYPEPGAYQEVESPYDSWYHFEGDKDHYKSWWGFESLPEVEELDPSWQDYVIKGEDSVFRFWLDRGAYGFRLDVADELPDEVIELMRDATKKKNVDKVLLGEVWEDATTKTSYGKKRTYALGRGLDSVMNYPFRDRTIAWLAGYDTACHLANFLNAQRANYPQPMYEALMNLLSSHDVARLRTVLAAGTEGKEMSRQEQVNFTLNHEMERRGAKLSRLAMALQFLIPGVPSVYYGDEYGMTGFGDPFNRGTLERKDTALADYVKKLSLLRKGEAVLRTGSMSAKGYGDHVLAVLRCVPLGASGDQKYADAGIDDRKEFPLFVSLLNPTDKVQKLTIKVMDFVEGLTWEERELLADIQQTLEQHFIAYLVQVVMTASEGSKVTAVSRTPEGIQVTLEAMDMVILRIGYNSILPTGYAGTGWKTELWHKEHREKKGWSHGYSEAVKSRTGN